MKEVSLVMYTGPGADLSHDHQGGKVESNILFGQLVIGYRISCSECGRRVILLSETPLEPLKNGDMIFKGTGANFH